MSATDVEPGLSDAASPAMRPAAEGLWSRSFIGLLIVQFCTALNDNTFRWIVVPVAKPLVGDGVALAVGLAGFTLPFLILASPAGFLADRFSKARVITACRFTEAIVLGIGLAALLSGSATLLFGIVFLTGALTAMFAPAKLGCIPEIVRDSELSTANGLMGLTVVVPSAIGFLAGNVLAGQVLPDRNGPVSLQGLGLAAAVVMTVAISGWLGSLLIRRGPAAAPERRLSWNMVAETVDSLGHLWRTRPLFKTALGIAFFWSLAALAQINIDQFGIKDLGLKQQDIGVLGMVLVLGLGGGSLLAGYLSAGRIELGLVPVGAAGVTLFSLALYVAGLYGTTQPGVAFLASCAALFGLGLSAGLFDIPLEAFLQHRSPPAHIGQIMAALNFLVFTGVLLVSGLFYVLHELMNVTAGTIFLLAGLGTVPVGIYIATQLPQAMFCLLFWVFAHSVYRLRVYGRERFPREGGVLLVPNHVSWVDGILLLVSAPRPIRFIIYADYVHHPRLRWLAKVFDVIPIKANSGPKALIQSLRVAKDALSNGECVCIFPEGTLTRTGQMQPFQPGFLKIVQGTGAPVLPVSLHGLWGSIFSYRGGKFFWKWPRQLPYPVSISFGQPIESPQSVEQVSRAVLELGAAAVELHQHAELNPPRKFLRACHKRSKHPKVADSTGAELTGGKLLAASLVLRRGLLRVVSPAETHIGILLPPTVGCALANLAVTLARRTTVNLNYTMSEADLRFCAKEAGLKHVLTSRKMLEKKPVDLGVEWVFLEDLKEKVTTFDKLAGGFGAFVCPIAILERWLGLTRIKPTDVITVIFTSGSTGEPKGVLLTHHNISATVDAADQVFQIDDKDVVLGVVPIFHSLGYLATLWLPLCLYPKVVYHINPLDGRVIGELAATHKATILFGTPTFLRTYLKRCDKEQFATLDLVVVGAEKLPPDLAQQFQEKFGVLPTEGYGATETCGPAAVNVPDHRCEMVEQRGTKLGTIGRPLPGVAIRIVDPETREPKPLNTEGLVEVKGFNVMLGYLNRPEKTAAVIRDGWYDTGDMGFIDDENFIHITGRLSRFSKIGGEMVPHIKIEETLLSLLPASDGEGDGPMLAVTAVPDPKRGERLVVLHRPLPMPVGELLKELGTKDLPNLWLPDAEAFVEVPEIPLLGTGKSDLKGIKQIALERFAPA
jgi:acyl-[acyl-carrier-protein]-phospholipid O-acyltransferase / long-chain-fatty-acid--[acyl-carrier-protein] ligase